MSGQLKIKDFFAEGWWYRFLFETTVDARLGKIYADIVNGRVYQFFIN